MSKIPPAPLRCAAVLLLLFAIVGRGAASAGELDARNWQLFIDDFAVARGTGFDRVVHHPRPAGIVIANDKPWESHGVEPIYFARKADGTFVGYYAAIWWMPNTDARSSGIDAVVYSDGRWRTRVPDIRPQDRDQQYVFGEAFATSRDGVHWEKPNLGLTDAPSGVDWRKFPPYPSPVGSSRENNLLGASFQFSDLGQYGGVGDPARRYAFFFNHKVYFSPELPDFIHDPAWRSKLGDPAGRSSPRGPGLSFWDPGHREWVAIGQGAVPRRVATREMSRFASPDLQHWRSEIVLTADSEDPHVPANYEEPMMLTPFVSDGAVMGLLSWFHGDRTTPDGGPVLDKASEVRTPRDWKPGWPWPTTTQYNYALIWPSSKTGVNEMRITISHDGGLTWSRASSREAWIAHGSEDDSYDRLVLAASPPVRVGDEDWFYMGVFDGNHGASRDDAAHSTYYHDRMRKGRIALYIQKRDRYVSLRTGSVTETLITKPFTIEGDTLQLNVDADHGRVKVGIVEYKPVPTLGLQPDSTDSTVGALSTAPHLMEENVLPGYGLDDCQPILGNGAEEIVRFKNGSSLKSIQGRKVVLFIRSTHADLYGFRVR